MQGDVSISSPQSRALDESKRIEEKARNGEYRFTRAPVSAEELQKTTGAALWEACGSHPAVVMLTAACAIFFAAFVFLGDFSGGTAFAAICCILLMLLAAFVVWLGCRGAARRAIEIDRFIRMNPCQFRTRRDAEKAFDVTRSLPNEKLGGLSSEAPSREGTEAKLARADADVRKEAAEILRMADMLARISALSKHEREEVAEARLVVDDMLDGRRNDMIPARNTLASIGETRMRVLWPAAKRIIPWDAPPAAAVFANSVIEMMPQARNAEQQEYLRQFAEDLMTGMEEMGPDRLSTLRESFDALGECATKDFEERRAMIAAATAAVPNEAFRKEATAAINAAKEAYAALCARPDRDALMSFSANFDRLQAVVGGHDEATAMEEIRALGMLREEFERLSK